MGSVRRGLAVGAQKHLRLRRGPDMIDGELSHFEILKEIGADGMGFVYRARDLRLHGSVAIKVLPSELRPSLPAGLDPIVARMLAREADERYGSRDELVENLHRLKLEPGRVAVERRTRLGQRWFEAEQLGDLKELALAEYRASRRRIRLRCEE